MHPSELRSHLLSGVDVTLSITTEGQLSNKWYGSDNGQLRPSMNRRNFLWRPSTHYGKWWASGRSTGSMTCTYLWGMSDYRPLMHQVLLACPNNRVADAWVIVAEVSLDQYSGWKAQWLLSWVSPVYSDVNDWVLFLWGTCVGYQYVCTANAIHIHVRESWIIPQHLSREGEDISYIREYFLCDSVGVLPVKDQIRPAK